MIQEDKKIKEPTPIIPADKYQKKFEFRKLPAGFLTAVVLCLFSRLLLTNCLRDLPSVELSVDVAPSLVAAVVGFNVTVGSITGGL